MKANGPDPFKDLKRHLDRTRRNAPSHAKRCQHMRDKSACLANAAKIFGPLFKRAQTSDDFFEEIREQDRADWRADRIERGEWVPDDEDEDI